MGRRLALAGRLRRRSRAGLNGPTGVTVWASSSKPARCWHRCRPGRAGSSPPDADAPLFWIGVDACVEALND